MEEKYVAPLLEEVVFEEEDIMLLSGNNNLYDNFTL